VGGVLCYPAVCAPTNETLVLTTRAHLDDPFVRAVCGSATPARPFAGVALDFSQRSRVKLAGEVDTVALSSDGTLTLSLRANEHMGNCPKYITVRELRPTRREAETIALGKVLPAAARALLLEASTVFIATRHVDPDPSESDMGLNHRGGPKGFLRYFEDEHGGHLELPDYSGNRFYQSLGNVETDPVMGVAVPDFLSGALLQVTGRARNLFDAAVERLMPGASLVTLVSIDEAFLTAGALDLEQVGDEQPSPYNPGLRTLTAEAPADRKAVGLRARCEGRPKLSTGCANRPAGFPSSRQAAPRDIPSTCVAGPPSSGPSPPVPQVQPPPVVPPTPWSAGRIGSLASVDNFGRPSVSLATPG
jgi:hypothetical protein